jgi:hypothetical protein
MVARPAANSDRIRPRSPTPPWPAGPPQLELDALGTSVDHSGRFQNSPEEDGL